MNSTVAGYVASSPTTITPGSTVTVEPGTNIKFTGLNGEPGQIWANGTLDVEGAASAPAVFTSRYDDSAGGHCSCAGTGTPSQGDWYGLSTSLTGGTIILNHRGPPLRLQPRGQPPGHRGTSHAQRQHRGAFRNRPALGGRQCNRRSKKLPILSGDNTGLKFECFGCSYGPIVTGTSFSSDDTGVWVTGLAAPILNGSQFASVRTPVALQSTAARTVIAHSTTDASSNFVSLASGSLPTGSVRLSSDLPYFLQGQVTIPPSGQLTLASGSVIKASVSPNPGQLLINGSLVSAGANNNPAVITSEYDNPTSSKGVVGLRAWRPRSRAGGPDHDLGRRQRRAREHHDPVCRERGRPGRFRVERERRQQHTRGLRQRDLCRRRDPHPPLFHA